MQSLRPHSPWEPVLTRTIISLTTIPPRMPHLWPILESLLKQTAQVDSIILWVPDRYRRAEFSNIIIPDLPRGVEVRRCELDYGPATKVLPAVRHFAGEDVRILYCDDDRIYNSDWAERMIAESDRFPDDCICEAGERVEATILRAFGNTWKYQVLTKSTLGMYGHFHRRKIRALDPGRGLVDIAKGYGGVLVRPYFIPASAFDIPTILWTVDDFWLSGQMALNGVKIRKVARREHSTKTEVAEVEALVDLLHGGVGRDAANLECVRYFRVQHGIWGGNAAARGIRLNTADKPGVA
jgi:hypothetical protein